MAPQGVALLIWLTPLSLATILPLDARSQISKRALQPAALPAPWQFIGCFSDSPEHRVLSRDGYYSTTAMTGLDCAKYCIQKGYTIAGTEWGAECYCDTVLDPTAVWYPPDQCAKPCTGNAAEACGGYGMISVYSDATPGPFVNPGVNGYTYSGCYSDSWDTRTLFGPFPVAGGADHMTVAECTAACNALGYSVAGLEYSGECWCGNSIESWAQLFDETESPDVSGCNMLCKGNLTEYCGGSWKLSIYSKTPANKMQHGPANIADSPVVLSSAPADSTSLIANSTQSASSTSTSVASISASSTTFSSSSSSTAPAPLPPTASSSSSTTTLTTSATMVASATTAALMASSRVPVNVITGGEFEDPALWSSWNALPDPSSSNAGALKALGPVKSTDAYNGSYSYQISEDPTLIENSARTLCLQQNITFARAGQYAFIAYIGRIAYPLSDLVSSTDQISYTVYIDGNIIYQGRVCNPSIGDCTVAAQSGKKMYNAVTGTYQVAASAVGGHNFRLCTTFSSIGKTGKQDVFLVDSISLVGPSRGG
ncbi:WSC-domain-containing protein [Amniculicola lignicola CBS 123094]|uniref:WSC-domain-containing protein n=1 Tax=Amniculicola lignicola CBS 123094 TaxID=1392246 RepID=A0A6A5W0X3_9PLEO|nr:WSC-domain-containing protein [Amniculicola lignicola CBS 123094]